MLNIKIQRLFFTNYFVAENVAKLALRAPDYCFGYRYLFPYFIYQFASMCVFRVEKGATNR